MTEEENHAYELELQEQEESPIEQMDKFLEKINDNADAILNISIDVHKTLKVFSKYVQINKELSMDNHNKCISEAVKTLNMENKNEL